MTSSTPTKLMHLTVGANRGLPRVFIESSRLRDAGLDIGARYVPEYDARAKRVRLTVSREDGLVVCRRKRSDGYIPLIDLKNKGLSMFGVGTRVVVAIYPDRVEIDLHHQKRREQERLDRLMAELDAGEVSKAELCAGGGVMAQAMKDGLERSGVTTSLKFAIEMQPEYASSLIERCAAVDAGTMVVQGGIQEVDVSRLPQVSVLAAGLPCTGASLSGRAKNKLARPEDHASAGHLFFHFLRIVEAVNPAVVVVENVPQYVTTVSYAVIRSCLEEWGYRVDHRILDQSLGAFERRERMVMLAQTSGLDIRFGDLAPAATPAGRLADLLEDIPAEDARFKRYDYLKRKEAKDLEAGKHFRQQLLTPDSTGCGVIARSYQKVRSTEPRLLCPSDPEKSRLLTVAEHARVKGVPPALVKGLPDMTAHEILGQGVLYPKFVAVGAMIGVGLKRLVGWRPRRMRGGEMPRAQLDLELAPL